MVRRIDKQSIGMECGKQQDRLSVSWSVGRLVGSREHRWQPDVNPGLTWTPFLGERMGSSLGFTTPTYMYQPPPTCRAMHNGGVSEEVSDRVRGVAQKTNTTNKL